MSKDILRKKELFSFEGAKEASEEDPVMIAKRNHPYPCRTRKLSSLASMILGGRLPGKVERCRNELAGRCPMYESGIGLLYFFHIPQ